MFWLYLNLEIGRWVLFLSWMLYFSLIDLLLFHLLSMYVWYEVGIKDTITICWFKLKISQVVLVFFVVTLLVLKKLIPPFELAMKLYLHSVVACKYQIHMMTTLHISWSSFHKNLSILVVGNITIIQTDFLLADWPVLSSSSSSGMRSWRHKKPHKFNPSPKQT